MDFGFFNWMSKIRRYAPFTRKELAWLGLGILIMMLIVGF